MIKKTILTGLLALTLSTSAMSDHDQISDPNVVIDHLKYAVFDSCKNLYGGEINETQEHDRYPYCENEKAIIIYRSEKYWKECVDKAALIQKESDKLAGCSILAFHKPAKWKLVEILMYSNKNEVGLVFMQIDLPEPEII